jgi:hypothetical protein
METRHFSSIAELAAAEKVDKSYVSKILRLTLLAPDLVVKIMDGPQQSCRLDRLLSPLPLQWEGQRKMLG